MNVGICCWICSWPPSARRLPRSTLKGRSSTIFAPNRFAERLSASAYARSSGPGAVDQKPVPPAFPDKILRQCIGQHRARGRCVEDVPSAIFLAQVVVARTCVENEGCFISQGIGEGEDCFCPRICHDETGSGLYAFYNL